MAQPIPPSNPPQQHPAVPLVSNRDGSAAQIPSKGGKLPSILSHFLNILIKIVTFHWLTSEIEGFFKKRNFINKIISGSGLTNESQKQALKKSLNNFSLKELEKFWTEENKQEFISLLDKLPQDTFARELVEALTVRIRLLPQLFLQLNRSFNNHYSEKDVKFYYNLLKDKKIQTLKALQVLIFEAIKLVQQRPTFYNLTADEAKGLKDALTNMDNALANDTYDIEIKHFYTDIVNSACVANTQELDESRKLLQTHPLDMRRVPLLHRITPTPSSLLCEFHVHPPSFANLRDTDEIDFKGSIEFQITDPKTLETITFHIALPFAGKKTVKEAKNLLQLIALESREDFEKKYKNLGFLPGLEKNYRKEWEEFLDRFEKAYSKTLILIESKRKLFEQKEISDYQFDPSLEKALKAAAQNSLFIGLEKLSLLPLVETPEFEAIGRFNKEEEEFFNSEFKQVKDKFKKEISVVFMDDKKEKQVLKLPLTVSIEREAKEGFTFLQVTMNISSEKLGVHATRITFYKIPKDSTESETRKSLADNHFFIRDLLLTKGNWYRQALDKMRK